MRICVCVWLCFSVFILVFVHVSLHVCLCRSTQLFPCCMYIWVSVYKLEESAPPAYSQTPVCHVTRWLTQALDIACGHIHLRCKISTNMFFCPTHSVWSKTVLCRQLNIFSLLLQAVNSFNYYRPDYEMNARRSVYIWTHTTHCTRSDRPRGGSGGDQHKYQTIIMLPSRLGRSRVFKHPTVWFYAFFVSLSSRVALVLNFTGRQLPARLASHNL